MSDPSSHQPPVLGRRAFSGALMLSPWVVALSGPAQAAGAAVGLRAPGFSAPDTSGTVRQLSDFKGKLVVLEWTNTGCPFVRKHYTGNGAGNMQRLQKEFTARGVVWLAINSTESASSEYLAPAGVDRWMSEKQAAPTATLIDESGQTGHLYGAKTTPHMYIISPQGLLLYAGAIDSIASARVDDIKLATNYVRQGLNEALAGKALSVASTRPYGCSVQYKA
ncbi:thioredoxin family protein [Polaromonas sp.]|uniref:thioredoxin family protein n=1 Tax=Polaromonas sp. TaxID=1869339 RepID=UPI00286CE939|nr:thioredoxin family protein [Polaromonas sp.]